MTPLIWPAILAPSSESWNANKGSSRSGGRTLTNQEQVVVGPSGYATATLTVPCSKPAKVLAMRAALALGRAQLWFVGPCEVVRAPWFVEPLVGTKVTYGFGRTDAAVDPAFEVNADTASTLDFRTAAPVAMNATAMTIQRNRGGLLQPGMMFSIDNRLHVITALTTPDPGATRGQATAGQVGIEFRPWLRADVPAGASIEFGQPRSTMRFATDDAAAMELQLSRFGTVTVDFVEAF